MTNEIAIPADGFNNKKLFFPNGRGISVINDGYGRESGRYELAVLKGTEDSWELDYSTEITSDVVGWLDETEVVTIAMQVRDLPSTTGELESRSVHELR